MNRRMFRNKMLASLPFPSLATHASEFDSKYLGSVPVFLYYIQLHLFSLTPKLP